jgi:transcriptional regulator with XRE-family HTH domain
MEFAHSVSSGEIRRALGDTLRRAREDGRRTLTEVAREAAISPAHLSEVERGLKDISTDLLVAVTHALAESEEVPRDPRRQLRIAAARLPEESVRSLAQFSAFLATSTPKPRIGFVTGEPRR